MTVRTGDKIKVTLEGKVRYAGDDSSDISLFSDYGAEFQIGGVSNDAITVVESKPKVGDRISRRAARDLPVGSVVQWATNGFQIVGDGGELFDGGDKCNRQWDSTGPDRTIVFLPN